MEKKTCTKCKKEKLLREFGQDNSRLDGKFPWCKKCRRNPRILKDLSGQIFGRLTVLNEINKINNRRAWLCICICNKKVKVLQQSLVSGATKSCGCLQKEKSKLATIRVLTNEKFGDWTVKNISSKRGKSGGVFYFCECSCGIKREVSSTSLISGQSQSCGKCKKRIIKNQVFIINDYCSKGHSIVQWGLTNKGTCRACVKEKSLKRNYDIDLVDYMKIWEFQNGKCPICGEELILGQGTSGWNKGSRTEVDHAHVEGPKRETVRGLLCGGRWYGCNRRLGKVDDSDWLESALEYITNPPAQMVLWDDK